MSAHARGPELGNPMELGDNIHPEHSSKKKGFLESMKEKLRPKIETLPDQEKIEVNLQILGDKAQLGLESAVKSIKGIGEKGWDAVQGKVAPAVKAMLKNRIAQLSTVSGATGLLATMLARSTMKHAVLSGIRNVGNIGAVGMGTVAGAIVGGSWGGGAELLAEHKRIKGERSYEAYESLLSQEEIDKLAPLDRAKRLVAAKSLLSRQRARFEHKGFYGTEEQLAMVKARLHAIDVAASMGDVDLGTYKNTYERLNKALEMRDSVDKELSSESSKDLELIKKCEQSLSAGVRGDKVKRGIKVGLVVGGLGGLAGSFLGLAFGSHPVDAPKLSASAEDYNTQPQLEHVETQLNGTINSTEIHTPENAPAETPQGAPIETKPGLVPDAEKPSVPAPESPIVDKPQGAPVETTSTDKPAMTADAEKPTVPAEASPKVPVETNPGTVTADKNPSSFKLAKDQTTWGEVGKIAEQNGIKLTTAEQNEWTRKITEFNKIGIKADGELLGDNKHFDIHSQINEEIKLPEEFRSFIDQRGSGAVAPSPDSAAVPDGTEVDKGATPEQPAPKFNAATDATEQKPDAGDTAASKPLVYPNEHPNSETPPADQLETKPPVAPPENPAPNPNPETPEAPEEKVDYVNAAIWGLAIGLPTGVGVLGAGYGIKKAWEIGSRKREARVGKGALHSPSNRSEKVEKAKEDFESLRSEAFWPLGIRLNKDGVLLKDYKKHIKTFEKVFADYLKLTIDNGERKLWQGARFHLIRSGEKQKLEGDNIYIDIAASPEEQAKLFAEYLRLKAGQSISSPEAVIDNSPASPDQADAKELETWMKMGREDKGIVGEANIRNYGEVMRMDGKSSLDLLHQKRYLSEEKLKEIRELITVWGRLSDLDKEGKDKMKQAFEMLHSIQDDNPRSDADKVISQIVSWDKVLLGPIAKEVDESRKLRHVRTKKLRTK